MEKKMEQKVSEVQSNPSPEALKKINATLKRVRLSIYSCLCVLKDNTQKLWSVPICFKNLEEAEMYCSMALKDSECLSYTVKKIGYFSPYYGKLILLKKGEENEEKSVKL